MNEEIVFNFYYDNIEMNYPLFENFEVSELSKEYNGCIFDNFEITEIKYKNEETKN